MLDQFIGDSEFVRGMLALAIMGAVIGAALGAIRYTPRIIWQLIQRRWAVSVTTRDQALIRWIGLWMAQSSYGKTCQWLDARTVHAEGGLVPIIVPGHGMHTFVEDGVRYWLEHALEDQGVAGKKSVLTIKTIGKGGQPLRNLIDLAVEMANEESRDKNVTYVNDQHGWWSRVRLSPLRTSSSLFLRDGMYSDILEDSRRFLDNVEWYQDRGLPYRRGYLLYGPAGNGKSTVVQVLATELNLPIYMLGLTEPELTDNGLARALGRTPARCLLVIEDFEKIDLSKTDVTMSGLLNAIDGPLASEGRLLIMTANEPEAISEYFLRPGRVDRRWKIDYPDANTIEMCMARFSVNGASIGPVSEILDQAAVGEWSMARVQQELLTVSGMGGADQYAKAGLPDPEPEPVEKRASAKESCNCGPDGGCDRCSTPEVPPHGVPPQRDTGHRVVPE